MNDLNTKMKSVLDQIMAGGKDLYAKGENLAAEKLGVGDDANSRETMRNTALAGGAAAAVLGLLLGTKTGRSATKTGVLLGGLGMLGKMAYDAYAKRSAGAPAPDAAPVGELAGPAADARSAAILSAMIAAAKADGHIDDAEKKLIQQHLAELGPDAQTVLMDELSKPLVAAEIAALADSDQARREIYAVSALVCGGDDPKERAYLGELAAALGLEAGIAAEIEAQVVGA
ncbi:MAG: tellurite resistance TerB family protein [Rubrimonas sp.]|uniref:tellurite resistance TerB family protein n=1 Tax=Rubrimonas sp. TaxID=2036015 RepID=UPI002FDD9750